MLNRTLIHRDTMLLPNRFNASTKAERMEPSFSLSFCPCFLWFPSFPSFFLFLPFPCSVAIPSPVFFLFLGLFRLVCWCCFMSFHCCTCFLLSCYLILLVFSVSHLPFLPFLFCFSLFFHVYRLSFLIFSHSLCFILGFRWCRGRGAKKVSREGAVAKCCRVLVGAHASRQGLCGWDK